jgi:hypothetical protein
MLVAEVKFVGGVYIVTHPVAEQLVVLNEPVPEAIDHVPLFAFVKFEDNTTVELLHVVELPVIVAEGGFTQIQDIVNANGFEAQVVPTTLA